MAKENIRKIVPVAGEMVRYGKDEKTGEYIRGAKVAYLLYDGEVCIGVEAVKATKDLAEFCDNHKGECFEGCMMYDSRGRAAHIYAPQV